MKGMRAFLVISVLLLSSPCVNADDWDAYNQWWLSHYYSFDPKAFTNISCEVSSSLVDEGTAALLASHPSVKAGTALYEVSVDNAGTIHISDPALQLVAVDPSRAATVPLVAEMVQSKYQLLAATIDRDIKGILDNYTPPDRKNAVIEKFVLDEDGAVVTRRDIDVDSISTATIHGADLSAQSTQSATFGGQVVHAQGVVTMHFEMADGKYVPVSEEEDVIQQSGVTKLHLVVKTTIDYQYLSGIRFPKTADFTDERGSDLNGTENRVEFKNCKVTK